MNHGHEKHMTLRLNGGMTSGCTPLLGPIAPKSPGACLEEHCPGLR